MSVLEAREVRKRFGGIQAIDGVSLAVEPREIVGIIGPNGSGKSTLFDVVTGTVPATSGDVLLDGRSITGWSAHRVARAGVARTFQIPALFDNMTVRENLLAALVQGDWKSAPRKVDEAIDLLDLGRVADDLASGLSGGQQRLLEFARVLVRDPRLILLDEVTAGVHPTLRETILRAVTRLRDDGTTFLVIEHDMELVRNVCERIVVMDAGSVVVEGTFDEVASNRQVMEAYLGVPTDEEGSA